MGGWKAVVFDLDGTLTDTLGDLAAATNEALRRHGFPAVRWKATGIWWATARAS